MPIPRSADPLWYKDAVFYQLHVKSFADSNGDGIGDFPGLTSKLDHLASLGVDCLWLQPMYPSPFKDDGYDISDYTSIHPSYGTLQDFEHFLNQAHARGLRVIIELVLNHTSDQHAWFQEARSSRDNPRRDWYVWSDTDDRYRGVRIIFIDTELSNWAWDPVSKAYYWHRFFSHQPDLNYDNPAVREEIWKVMKFWLDLGVDGFRVDAVPYLVEREGTSCENLPETHAVLKELRARLDAHFTGKVLLAEANMWPEDVRPYFGAGDEFHMSFHFPIMPRMFMALRLEDRKPLIDIIERTPSIPDSCQWGIFLRNHDELTLEMVTEIERQYMWDEYAKDPRARINLGIRRRLAPLMEGDRRRIELMSGLLMSLPGSPILYYGDEIGMGDNVYLGDRNSVRTPMQWNGGVNAGFSTADPERLWLPLISNAALRLSGRQRRVAAAEPDVAPELDAAPHRGSALDAGLRPRLDRVPQARQPSRAGVHAHARTRDGARRQQPRRNRAGGRSSICPGWPAPSRSRCSAAASFRASDASRTS